MTKNSASVLRLKLKQTESPAIKRMTHRLLSKINQNGFSKSSTTPQLAGTVVYYKNAKEHLKNKVNQKKRVTPINHKYFSRLNQIETKL